ncbi:MAG: EamA family transporter [Saprospiraceae bacterium]|nr:EamA family transporter [Saprospiraceae bacterium]MDZ4703120.1 EamA family transporter [Saprospiraceae bacterium]
MNKVRNAYIELHIAVLLFGFTAILGDLIQLSALALVWWRVLFTTLSLLPLAQLRYLRYQLPRRTLWSYFGVGALVGMHWIAFYGAIKLSNASIALVCMATTSFFTALVEPLLMRQRFKGYELALGALIVPGMALIVNGVRIPVLSGLAAGLAAAFLAALFATLNKKIVGKTDEKSVTFVEMGSAWMFLSVIWLLFFASTSRDTAFWPPALLDWIYLLILALLCTTLAYVLALRALRHLSAFTSNLAINLEPVYGIALAWLILKENEDLSGNFYWGVAIILLMIFVHPLLRRYFEAGKIL